MKRFLVEFDYDFPAKGISQAHNIEVEAYNEKDAINVARCSHLLSGGNFHAWNVNEV